MMRSSAAVAEILASSREHYVTTMMMLMLMMIVSPVEGVAAPVAARMAAVAPLLPDDDPPRVFARFPPGRTLPQMMLMMTRGEKVLLMTARMQGEPKTRAAELLLLPMSLEND